MRRTLGRFDQQLALRAPSTNLSLRQGRSQGACPTGGQRLRPRGRHHDDCDVPAKNTIDANGVCGEQRLYVTGEFDRLIRHKDTM
jgi:hypothetical protein